MLEIRSGQIDGVSGRRGGDVVDFIISQLRLTDAELTTGISDEGLRGMVEGGVARAKRHGFDADEDLLTFVSVMFRIAPNFDNSPEIRNILDRRDLSPEAKWDALTSPSMENAWEEARNADDPAAWWDDDED